MKTKTKKQAAPQPIKRLGIRQAAERLLVSRDTLIGMCSRGIFTVQQDIEEGNRFLFVDELDFWLESIGPPEVRVEALRAFRQSKNRIRPTK